ncbi:MAG: hypothetical protein Q9168_000261 [Polycauliona sp. 1 TL-2023]
MNQECHLLRLELKEWEKSFAGSNNGKKAGREDIKQHPEIAAKYKIYNNLRSRALDGGGDRVVSVQGQLPTKSCALTNPPAIVHTPRKRLKHLHSFPKEAAEAQSTCDSAQNSPVAHRKSIGPTPQKNGHVLGLFDLLTPSSSSTKSSQRRSLQPIPLNLLSASVGIKSTKDDDEPNNSASPSAQRKISPSSTSKAARPASFTTPSKRRIADTDETPTVAKPVSRSRCDDTPAFLRRDSQKFSHSQQLSESCDHNEDDVFSWSPVAPRVMRPKPAGRGLSALVKGLRDMEEARLDDELELLREMEEQECDHPKRKAKPVPKICVEDSQIPDMPLGPDGEGESEREDLDALKLAGQDRRGRPLKMWKKKGQKRTTRRVTMKPNAAKWKPEQEWTGGRKDESDEEVVAVVEAQTSTSASDVQRGKAEGIQTDNDGVDEGVAAQGIQEGQMHGKELKHINSSHSPGTEPPKGRKKRMVNAAAHANYRALKIRNKNSKGKGPGRFGRRR